MSIYFGNDAVNDLYIGLTPVSKGYVGTHLFYNGDSTIIDSTYEKYILNTRFSTLYNTEEAPIKSAILKGNTLVNLSKFNKDTEITSSGGSKTMIRSDASLLKTNTVYTFIYWIESTSDTSVSNITTLDGSSTQMFDKKILRSSGNLEGNFILKFSQTSRDFTGSYGLKFSSLNGSVKLVKSVILEGDYTNVDIPYFEDMTSVKMPVLTTTGKNIVGDLEIGGLDANGNNNTITLYTRSSFILLKKDTTYAFSLNGVKRSFHLYLYDLNKNFKVKVGMANEYTPEVDCYIRIFQMDDLDKALYQVEKGTIATPYEPYKSNILMVNEDVTLRSNGDICDELNLLTGQLKQRIGEDGVVLSQEVVKTVDLSVVDQDGNGTKLSSFEDITHVTVTSEGILPYVELKVATKNEEVLNTMSLKMDDIYATQTTLEETSNAQSENVDATMMATTEIYEQLL